MSEERSRERRGPWLDAPKAILIGSAVVAVGVYLGLRDRGPVPPATTASPMAERPGATPPQSAQPAIASSTPSAAKPDIDAASKSARAAVEAQKKKLVEACWEPAGATAKGSEAVTYTINFTFGPDGKQVARGIAEPRGASRPRLVNCMQLALPPVTIPPPGEAIALEVPFTLP